MKTEMKTEMETSAATAILGRMWYFGDHSPAAKAIEECQEASRGWHWTAANAAMERAYAALGAVAPAVSVRAIHRGEHPVQVAAHELMRGIMEDRA